MGFMFHCIPLEEKASSCPSTSHGEGVFQILRPYGCISVRSLTMQRLLVSLRQPYSAKITKGIGFLTVCAIFDG